MSEPVVIKRYQNRRLYDTESSEYVNVDRLAKLVKEGRTIKVVDAKTGEDLTRRFLTQILLESENALPLEVMQQLASVTDRAFRDFLNWYLSSAVAVYQQVQDSWKSQFEDLTSKGPAQGLGFTPGFPPAGIPKMWWDPAQMSEAFRSRWTDITAPAADAEAEPEEETGEPEEDAGTVDVDRLAQRLAELEKKLGEME
ncbi:MAG: polyhydroxyalkanoate synthesis regulator DNA-binding domain-containing protein [Acidobacteriota bacterium]|nr:polyhydroxyalkanoate synthesis regulator DNA-binding domain-containing protein [Acidobacteriota bacterium]